MPDDALERVLRMVADGSLTADDAAPLLDALDTEAPDPIDPTPPTGGSATSPGGGPGRAIRIEVTESGRQVVNLRVPLALGRAALRRVPGLSDATAERVREAVEAGVTGEILTVADGPGDAVRIVIE